MPSNSPSPGAGIEVLLTGGTGFIGKVMLEELLRRSAALGISRVFLLVRARGSKSPESRFSKILAAPCMAGLPPEATHKVTVVPAGNATLRCGMSDDSARMLASRVTHVIHCAGAVRFDLPLASAAEANITTALELLEFAKRCRKLDKMVSVSTAYVTPHREGPLDEELVPLPFDAEQLYNDILAGRDARRAFAAAGHPNTYTFAKCVAEHLLLKRREHVSIVLVRPSVVSATWRRPFPGWIDSTAGLAGFLLMIGSGRLRSVVADPASRLDVVPCDVVVDRILGAAFSPMKPGEFRIEHAVAGVENSNRISDIREGALRFFRERPFDAWPAVRYVGQNRLAHELHWRSSLLPVHAAMALAQLRGNGAALRRARSLQRALSSLNRSFRYFTLRTFDFRSRYALTASEFDPKDYLQTVCRGLYRHVLREDDVHVRIGGKKAKGAHGAVWAFRQVHATPAHRVLASLFAAGVQRCTDHVTVNLAAFHAAKAGFPANATIVIVPQATSVADGWFCSYLCLARADLGLGLPANLGSGRVANGRRRRASNQTLLLSHFSTASTWSQLQRLRDQVGVRHPVVLLPVSISYERRVEDYVQSGEISPGRPIAAARILRRILTGNLDLGRVDLSCGSPLAIDGITETTLDDQLAAEWRASHAALTRDREGSRARNREVDPAWCRAETRQRGGVLLEDSLVNASGAPAPDKRPSCPVDARVTSSPVRQR